MSSTIVEPPKQRRPGELARSADQPPEVIRESNRSIGAILIEQGRLSPDQVEEIQHFALVHGLRFGEAGVRLQLLSSSDIDMAVAQQFNYPLLPRGGTVGVSDELIAGYQPHGVVPEQLRALRSQLDLRWSHPERKVLAVTSPGRKDGRSWLAANLATVFAQMGGRTLLIDADMRHPRQHVLFNLKNAVGLSALLTGRAGREIVARVHPQLRLFVCPAGLLPPNPQELLGRQVFDVVLGAFAEQYDTVILDTPASTEVADAQMLAGRAGAAIVMARRNHTKRNDLAATLQTFQQAKVNVVGSVISDH